jgi:hypothetical protein
MHFIDSWTRQMGFGFKRKVWASLKQKAKGKWVISARKKYNLFSRLLVVLRKR